MLTHLSIKNFGLIDEIALDFNDRLNVLTGETGAGKSIIIDALRIALGAKISASQLRDSSLACKIEAQFEIGDELKNLEILRDYLEDSETTLIIQRALSPEGKSTIKINGNTVTAGQFKDIGRYLMDFHGPHDHQMLLSEDSHIRMLDRLSDLDELLKTYSDDYAQYRHLIHQLNELQELSKGREREMDFLAHQLKELEHLDFSEEAYEDVKSSKTRAQNSEKLYEYARQITDLLEGGQPSFADNIRKSFSPMKRLNDIDEKTAKLDELLTQLQDSHNVLLEELSSYGHSLSFDAKEAEDIYAKYDAYETVLKKFGPTLADAKRFYEDARAKYDQLANFEQNTDRLKSDIASSEKSLSVIAQKISKKRKTAADKLVKVIETELTELGIKNVRFDVRFETVEFNAVGHDRAVFYISPNAGHDLKPLADIVSSGEAARVMLALKKALVNVDPIPTLVFDEIDAQIGGRLGTVTGQKLRDIAQNRQVLLITHLPQIASFADRHFKITKSVKSGKAVTKVAELSREERVHEMAEMMSGTEKNKTSLLHAEEMLSAAGTKRR